MNVRSAFRNIALTAVSLTALGFAVSGAVANDTPSTPKPVDLVTSSMIVECEHEDGSNQAVCIHDDGTGDPIVNVDFGAYSYNLRTLEMKAY